MRYYCYGMHYTYTYTYPCSIPSIRASWRICPNIGIHLRRAYGERFNTRINTCETRISPMRFMGRTLDFTQNGPKMGPLIGRMLRGCCTLRALGTHPSTYSLIYTKGRWYGWTPHCGMAHTAPQKPSRMGPWNGAKIAPNWGIPKTRREVVTRKSPNSV